MTPHDAHDDRTADASGAQPGRAALGTTSRRRFLATTAAGLGASVGATSAVAQAGDELNAVSFDLSNLPALGEDAVYEGWAIFDEEKVSTGRFSTGQEYVFGVDRDLAEADELVITIEPAEDDDPAPSGIVVLAGELSDGEAELSFPVDLEDASGSYLMNTPTSPGAIPQSGVWFLQPDGQGGHEASLNLPDLSETGWTYEGWVVHDGRPITTGRFDDPSAADDAAPYSAEEPAPPFPGEDLIMNEPSDDLAFPTDLTDEESKVVVTVEPDADGEDPTGDAPFAFDPLAGEIPEDGEGGRNYELRNTDVTLPSGAAVVTGPGPAGVPVDEHVARDLDGDGLYMDVTGDGSVSQTDVVEFFRHHYRDDVQENARYFDYTGNGSVGHGDVVELFQYVAMQ